MNKKQKIAFCIGIIVFVLIGLFPDIGFYRQRWNDGSSSLQWRMPKIVFEDTTIDVARLVIYWMITVVVTGGIVYLLKGSKDWNMTKVLECVFWLSIAFVVIVILIILISGV